MRTPVDRVPRSRQTDVAAIAHRPLVLAVRQQNVSYHRRLRGSRAGERSKANIEEVVMHLIGRRVTGPRWIVGAVLGGDEE